MYEVKLYRLVNESGCVSELGWVNENQFFIWVPYWDLNEFMEGMVGIFGHGLYEDGAFNANFQDGCVCIDLTDVLSEYDLDFGEIFPKEEFKH